MATNKEKIVFEVEIDGKQAENSLEGLENRIEKLKDLRQGEQIGSKAFQDLSKDIQKAEAAIKDVELEFEALDFEQKLTAGSDAVVGLAGGFTAATGAMTLLGAESENLELALTKVAGALALSQGLRDLANGAIALRKLGGAAGVARKAQLALNAAMKANPIGVVVAAVAALVAILVIAIVKQKEYANTMSVTVQKTKALNAARLASLKSVSAEKQSLQTLLKVARDETKSKAAREQAIKKINEISPAYLGNINLENINSQKVAKAIDKYTEAIERKARAQAFSGKLAEIEAQILDEKVKTNEELAKQEVLKFNILGQTANYLEAITTNTKIENIQAREGLKISEEAVAALEVRKKAILELLNAEQEALLEDEVMTDTFEALQARKSKSSEDNADAEAEARAHKIRGLKAFGSDALEIIQEGLDEERDLRLEAQVTLQSDADIAAEIKLQGEKAYQAQVRDLVIESARFQDELRQKELDKAQGGLDFLSGLNNAFVGDEVKREKIRKKLAVAQIAIDTARAVSGAIAAGAAIPFPGNIPAILAGVTAVLAGIGQAKAILGAGDSGLSAASITGAATGTDGAQLNNISNTASLIDQDQQNLSQPVLVVESFNEANNNIALAEELSSF